MCNAVFRTPFSRCPLDGTKLAELEGDPLVGTVLDKRYVIEECIGEGGMGRVYRAKHTRMSRHYAIKILFGDHAGDTRMRSRFAREAEAVSRLSHVNVISVLDFGETEEGLLYLVMDLADGESLAELVHREAPLNPARAVDILARLAKGLAHAHSHGLVHRDFKCENVIMVTEEGEEVPKIVDFGICMIVEDAPASTMLTSNGMIMGTPAVMAPEQASGDKVDHRTDLFSLGIVGYQMVSGCLPFEGTPLEMARKNLYEPIPSIADRCGLNVDPSLEAVICGLTAKSPDDRYQNAQEVLEALRGLGISGPFDSWTNVTPVPSGSRPRMPQLRIESSAGFDATEAVSPLHADHTQYLARPSTSLKSKNSKILLGAVLGVACVGVALALALGGDSSKKDAGVATNTVVDKDLTNGTSEGTEPIQVPPEKVNTAEGTGTADPTKEPDPANGAGTVPDTPVVDPVVVPAVEPEATADTDDSKKPIKNTNKPKTKRERELERQQKRDRKAAAKAAKAAKAAARNKPAGKSQDALKKQHQRTLKLYANTAKSLTKLRKSHGNAVANVYKRKLDKISRSTLGYNMVYAQQKHGTILKINTQIISRQRSPK
jgi:serine/threonine protein kinase